MIQSLQPNHAVMITSRQNLRLGRVVRSVETGRLLQRPRVHRRYPPQGIGFLFALIAGHSEVSTNFWMYAWAQARAIADGRWDTKPGGLSSTVDEDPFALPAYNGCENPNNGSGHEGVGALVGTVGAAEITMLPIDTGVVVQLYKVPGVNRYFFSLPNDFDVECSGGEG